MKRSYPLSVDRLEDRCVPAADPFQSITDPGVASVSTVADSNQSTIALYNPGDQTNLAGDTVSLGLSASTPDNVPAFSATGLPAGLSIDPNTGIISGAIPTNAAAATPYGITVTINDSGAVASQNFNWTVNPPVLTWYGPGDQTNLAGDTVSLGVSASVTDNAPLTYSTAGLPAGLTIDPNSGIISGVIANNAAAASPDVMTITALDSSSGVSATETLNWTVNPPVLTLYSPGDQTNLAGDTVSLGESASITDNAPLTYSAAGLPAGLSIDPNSGTISGTIANNAAAASPDVGTITALDSSSGVSATQTLNWTVNPPVLTLYSPGDQTNLAGDTVSLGVSTSITDNAPLTYSAAGLPAGLSIDPNSGTISGAIANNAATVSPDVVTITALDSSSGVSATVTVNWTVNPPVLTLYSPGDQTNLAGDTVSLGTAAYCTDNAPLQFSAAGLPTGLSIDPNSGIISGTISTSAASATPYVVTITVLDSSSGVTVTQTLNWTMNTTPAITQDATPASATIASNYYPVIDIPLIDPNAPQQQPQAPVTPADKAWSNPWGIYGWDSVPLVPPVSPPYWY